MTLRAQIEKAFAHRAMPANVVEPRTAVTPEQRDALWFIGRDWRAVVWQDWERHPDAFYTFVPKAFAFYLPSVLIGALDAPNGLLAAEALVGVLDRSPAISNWDLFLRTRLLGLMAGEYDALKAWLLARSALPAAEDDASLGRAYRTVEMLEHETARLRRQLNRYVFRPAP
ncbi:hypothetical protein [Ramlibacter albus]|uniref:Uncharacterized protein n=1 Tax=Ramlibacter albus TaxID=2079448 RepID=A0A923S5K7_9BURK|nr:hypothetical protein [Ramlibacter albus]MBC5768724.1 hypothetical protein [Ramlibacter albus]